MKKTLFSLLILCSFSFLEAKAGLREDLSKKKYSFSVPVLDEVECLNRVVLRGEDAEDIFKLMWEDALNGNEKIQKKLITLFKAPAFYEKAKARVPLLQNVLTYSLENLIDIGISQKKSWAFYEKALMEEDQDHKRKFLYKAFNNLNFEDKIDVNKCNLEFNKLIHGSISLDVNKKKSIDLFIKNCFDNENSIDLFSLYNEKKDKNFKNKNVKSSLLKSLKKSAELGYIPAYKALLDIFADENKNNFFNKSTLDEIEFYSRIVLDHGGFDAANILGMVLCQSNSKKKKREGAAFTLRAAELRDNPKHMLKAVGVLLNFTRNDEDKLRIRQICEEAEKLGDAMQAPFFLGITYLPDFLPEDSNLEKAALCFRKGAENESSESAYRYGLLLLQGFEGQEPNEEEGKKWILKSANQGNLLAMAQLGKICLDQAYDEGNKWILNASNQRILPAMAQLGKTSLDQVYDMEKAIYPEQLNQAYEWFQKAAESGDSLFTCNLGILLLAKKFGSNFPVSLAEKYLLSAAAQNDKSSFLFLSYYYHEASKTCSSQKSKKQMLKKMETWLEKTYQAGCFNDLLKTEQLQDLGKLEKQCVNYMSLPAFCFGMDAESKVKLLYNLALIRYKKYFRNPKEMEKVYNILGVCAKNNHILSMHKLGELWHKGFNNKKVNLDKAAKWYLRAAEQNHGPAMVALANLYVSSYEAGDSSQKLKNALFWYEKAKLLGEISAHDFLKISENLHEEAIDSDIESEEALVENIINQNADESFDFEDIKIDIQLDKNFENQKIESPCEEYELNVNFIAENHVEEKCSNFVNDQVIDNPKYIRNQLKKMGLLKKQMEEKENKQNIFSLLPHNQDVVDMLKDKMIKNKNIDFTQLMNLFSDPFFADQVTITRSKSGCVITAKNLKTLDYAVASTHKKHNKSYDGLNPAFARELLKVLNVFGL